MQISIEEITGGLPAALIQTQTETQSWGNVDDSGVAYRYKSLEMEQSQVWPNGQTSYCLVMHFHK